MREVLYSPADRPPVEVLVDDVWRYGELRMWTRQPDGWQAGVAWQPARGESYRLDAFAANQVRDLVDMTRYLSDV